MLVQALPVYIVARVFKNGTFVTLSAIIMAVLAIATGRSAYTAIDLFGIGAAYWMGLMHLTTVKKADQAPGSEHSANVDAARGQIESPEKDTPTHPRADASIVAFRQQMLGPVNETIHEQFAVLLAAMHVHLALQAGSLFGGIANQSKEKQDEVIKQRIVEGLERNNYEATIRRKILTRYVFDLYRDAYVAVEEMLPPSDRSLSTVQYRMAATAAEFLKTQFLADGVSDICAFLKVTARAVSADGNAKYPAATFTTALEKPKRLAFKSNNSAFEYACKYLVSRRKLHAPVVGIVLAVTSNGPCVKIANATDSAIPDCNYDQLLKTADSTYVCFITGVHDGVPEIYPGDLVTFLPLKIAPEGWLQIGMVLEKLERVLDTETGAFAAVQA